MTRKTMFSILNLTGAVLILGLAIMWCFLGQYVLFDLKLCHEYTMAGVLYLIPIDSTDLHTWYWFGLGCIIALAVLTILRSILLIRSNITARSKKLQKNTSEEIAALPAKTSIVPVQKRKVIRLHLK